jgi:F-type H+-transporting ATPase subunit epsilon
MRLKIVTPARVVLDEEVEALYAYSVDGEFGVLPKHIPMVTPLSIGVLRFVSKGDARNAAVMGGLFYTDGDSATVLSDNAELASEIDSVRAQHAKERAESRLRERDANVDVKRAEMALARALTRMKALR